MSGRVILFGASGFTGRLAAEAMTRAGLAPVLAGRSEEALVGLVGDLAGLGPFGAQPTWRTADATDPESVLGLVDGPDDVLVSTVGPFMTLGRPAVDAAIARGCGYTDSDGEGPFLQRLFVHDHDAAEKSGARLLPAFGFDFVPGNLAGALAIKDAHDAGRSPTVVDVGYFTRGAMQMSSGTRATTAILASERPLARRNGRVVGTSGAVSTFDVAGRQLDGLLIGSSEAFALPRIAPDVRDVNTYLGWAGKWTRSALRLEQAVAGARRIPGIGSAVSAGLGRAGGAATGEGPSPEDRARARTIVVARTTDGVGRVLSQARVEGPSPYDLTAELLAWAAAMLLTRRETTPGVLGPVDAFGLDALVSGCADMGLVRVA
jgi:short subunit dehydrogenase-like uncharacterized protein